MWPAPKLTQEDRDPLTPSTCWGQNRNYKAKRKASGDTQSSGLASTPTFHSTGSSHFIMREKGYSLCGRESAPCVCMCVHTHACACSLAYIKCASMQRPACRSQFSPPPCRSQGLDSDHRAWGQAPLPTESSCRPSWTISVNPSLRNP